MNSLLEYAWYNYAICAVCLFTLRITKTCIIRKHKTWWSKLKHKSNIGLNTHPLSPNELDRYIDMRHESVAINVLDQFVAFFIVMTIFALWKQL